jgi:hypothetical protein
MSFTNRQTMRSRNPSPFDAVIGRTTARSCVDREPSPESVPVDERANLFDAAAANPHGFGIVRRGVFLAFKETAPA